MKQTTTSRPKDPVARAARNRRGEETVVAAVLSRRWPVLRTILAHEGEAMIMTAIS